jgi:4-aminobutyrate aminotransferase-like enzyme
VSSAAAVATLDVIADDKLTENARAMGKLLRDGLVALQKQYPGPIGEVRGKGLMQGVELVRNEKEGDRTPMAEHAKRIFEETKKRGLLIGKGGLYGNVLRIAPALNISRADVEEALRILDESFAALPKA